ncbi:MAG: Fe-S cluster assembly protein SufD [Stellaceae bacterium]
MSDAMAAIKAEARPYLDAIREDAAEPEWLRDARRAARDAFASRGFPSRREEAWRFTNLRPLVDQIFLPSRRKPGPMVDMDTGLRRYGIEATETYRLVFINGRFSKADSRVGDLPVGVWLASVTETLAKQPELVRAAIDQTDLAGGQPFASLNAALFNDGFVLALDEGVTLDRPVEIIHIAETTEAASIHARNLVALRPDSRATVIETHIGNGFYWTNTVTQVALSDDAKLTHIRVQDEDGEALHFAVTRAELAARARYDAFTLTLGAGLSRQDIQVKLGDGARCDVNGAYLLRGDQDATHAVFVDHAAPNATTREIWKGVLDNRAHGAFLGSIAVRPAAQKTDAQQTSRALLLSDRASVDTKPELEILADDVKCAHGAAVGDLDHEALFYLRARGIDLDMARRMLVEAFVLEAIDKVEAEDVRAHLANHVRAWLGREAA